MITAIGVIKNSADIIENCIRCNSNVADNFVLLDNMSTDRTVEILESLKREGFQIEVIPDYEVAHTQYKKLTNLLYYCKEKYNSDVYIAIDDDEVLFAADNNMTGKNIKNYLKSLRDNRSLYLIKWRVYFPSESDDSNEISLPKRQSYYFDESHVPYHKCIIPNAVLEDGSFVLQQGNHSAVGNLIEHYYLIKELVMAHYPCRSIEQVTIKSVVGWLANLAIHKRNPTWSPHRRKMFHIITSGTPVDIELMKYMTYQYLDNDSDNMMISKGQLILDEKCFMIRYTDQNECNSLKSLILYSETLAGKLSTSLPGQFYQIPEDPKARFDALVKLALYTEKMAIQYANREAAKDEP